MIKVHAHRKNTWISPSKLLDFFQEQLRERVTALEGTLQSLTHESTKAVDELYKQLNEVKGQLETSDMKCDKLQTRVSKKKEKLAAKSLKIQKLKTSLTAKVLQLNP